MTSFARASLVSTCTLLCACGTPHHRASGDAGTDPSIVAAPQRLDLLLMVDNSWAMSTKQSLLADSAVRLVEQLSSSIPDIHVGVISSSLGDAGDSTVCSRPESKDMAHLLGSLERGSNAGSDEHGILSWRSGQPLEAFEGNVRTLIRAAGELGCGYEASLEAWYRFLLDPKPYASLQRVPCRPGNTATDCIGPSLDEHGEVLVDSELLAQRAAFLRPDSLLVLVTLSDENDCSIRVGDQSWRVSSQANPMPRGSSTCGENPNAACCYSCRGLKPDSCDADAQCKAAPLMTRPEDSISLRCFDQKRRFGADFLYPTERYVNALTQSELCFENDSLSSADCPGNLVANPLLAQRPRSRLVLAPIVGVPWQRITQGIGSERQLDTLEQLQASGWAEILGQPQADPPVAPADPFMIESSGPRQGIVSDNQINGREYDTSFGEGTPRDLEFACIFRLPEPADCSGADPAAEPACACAQDQNSPICEDVPGQSQPGAVQYWDRAFPAPRQLEVARGVGAAGGELVLGSACPISASDTARADYGYRPVADAILARLAPQLPAR